MVLMMCENLAEPRNLAGSPLTLLLLLPPVNRLLFGDNLGWLRDTREFPDASVDLEYLDPRSTPTPITTSFSAKPPAKLVRP